MNFSNLDFQSLNLCFPKIGFRFSPYLVFDACDGHETRNSFGSIKNEFEAKLCLKIISCLEVALSNNMAPTLAVISPYTFQCQRILELIEFLLPRRKIKVTVSTIDGFQGRESDIVIFSCVRNTIAGVGFMVDFRRLNVALTRAKFGLWILCSSKNSSINSTWEAMFKDVKRRVRLISASTVYEFMNE